MRSKDAAKLDQLTIINQLTFVIALAKILEVRGFRKKPTSMALTDMRRTWAISPQVSRASLEEVQLLLPWRLKWTLAQFAQPAEYQKHSAVLRSAPAFYLTLLEKLVPGFSSGVKFLALTDGHVIPVRDFMTLYIYKEIFVDRCYDLPFDQSAPVIIDIGANSGLFALRIKQLYPSAKISCYEPFPRNFAQLQNTIAINKLESVTPLQKAVGGRPGRAKLFIHKRNMGGHSFYVTETLNNDYVDVEVIDLPSILGELQQEVDLLKIDCEGAEFDILTSLTAADSRKIRQIIVETTPGLYDVDQLNAQMISLGYDHKQQNGLSVYTLGS